jgi:hypothetical protein
MAKPAEMITVQKKERRSRLREENADSASEERCKAASRCGGRWACIVQDSSP